MLIGPTSMMQQLRKQSFCGTGATYQHACKILIHIMIIKHEKAGNCTDNSPENKSNNSKQHFCSHLLSAMLVEGAATKRLFWLM